ncbi:hypothetical protein COLO4_25690 [Corchorus olitorius]|uniref:Uncharacterized protein n=1 Tax=Corchorus olitorius TaxID=93759 RepID=A0A1R3I0L7_9ROSI|nr:hypothetical protein COLO4_25690 [Corchorus olitorius]
MASTLDKARLWFLSVAAKFRKPCRNSNRSIPKSPRGAKTSNSKLLQAKKIENNKVTGARNDFDAVDAVGMYFAFKWVDSLWNHKQSVDENNHKDSKGGVGMQQKTE